MVRGSKTVAGGRVNLKKKSERAKHDNYPTPPIAIEKLLELEEFEGDILEPCSGAGYISKPLLSSLPNPIISFDIREDEEIYGTKGIDFLIYESNHDNIITNPPYALAQEFIEHGLKVINKRMALLLRLSYLEGQKRYYLFKHTPLSKVYVLSKRLPYQEDGVWKKSGAQFTHAWFVWDKGFKGNTIIDWIL